MSDDKTVQFSSEDEQMEAAIRKAKDTIGQFFEAFLEPTERQESFLVKVVFHEGERVEHIWGGFGFWRSEAKRSDCERATFSKLDVHAAG